MVHSGEDLPLAPLARGALEGGDDVLEVGQLVELRQVVPGRLRDPVGARVRGLLVLVEDLV